MKGINPMDITTLKLIPLEKGTIAKPQQPKPNATIGFKPLSQRVSSVTKIGGGGKVPQLKTNKINAFN